MALKKKEDKLASCVNLVLLLNELCDQEEIHYFTSLIILILGDV